MDRIHSSFKTCGHSCHKVETESSSTRKKAPLKDIHIFTTSSSGTARHNTLHVCGDNCPKREPWSTEADEFVKFGARLFWSKAAGVQKDILRHFMASWEMIYKTTPPIVNGEPQDFSADPNYTCAKPIPWLPFVPSYTHGAPTATLPATATTTYIDNEAPSAQLHDGQKMVAYLLKYRHKIDMSGTVPGVSGGFMPLHVYLEDPSRLKKLEVVFVLSPCWRLEKGRERHGDGVYSTTGEIDIDDMEAIRGAAQAANRDDFIKIVNKLGRGKVRCHYNAWLELAIEMREQENLWKLDFWSWEKFRDATLQANGHDWRKLQSVDLVIGGIHFTSDFLDLNQPLHGLNLPEVTLHYQRLKKLMETTSIWPNPTELLEAGSKLSAYQDAMTCCTAMGLDMPLIQVVGSPDESLLDRITAGSLPAVLKREYSGASQTIFTPHSNQDARNRILSVFESEKDTWHSPNNFFPRPQWFIQPYIPEILILGEIRAFFVNGHLYYAVCTTPQNKDLSMSMQVQNASMIRPLSTLRFNPHENPEQRVAWLVDPDLLPAMDERKFQNQAIDMMGGLVLCEEKKTGRGSGLRIFCRLDFSVYTDAESKEAKFFLNEVTREHATAMFPKWAGDSGLDSAWKHLSHSLHYATHTRLLVSPPPSLPTD